MASSKTEFERLSSLRASVQNRLTELDQKMKNLQQQLVTSSDNKQRKSKEILAILKKVQIQYRVARMGAENPLEPHSCTQQLIDELSSNYLYEQAFQTKLQTANHPATEHHVMTLKVNATLLQLETLLRQRQQLHKEIIQTNAAIEQYLKKLSATRAKQNTDPNEAESELTLLLENPPALTPAKNAQTQDKKLTKEKNEENQPKRNRGILGTK